MTVNEAGWDRVIRIVLGIVLLALYFTGSAGILALIIGVVALVTGLIGYCPLYKVIGFSTKK
ncbi:MAG: DUF2892 domain-containing protein [Chloroflexi bacterium]|nr:DUF2892 domain-containing protein [Chloroflexota bacterium]